MSKRRPFAAFRRFVSRRRWWILGAAAGIKAADLLLSDGLGGAGGIGELALVLSTLVLVVGGAIGLGWLTRRYLFSVSRRLGLAFVFVGVIPLLLLALLSVAIMGMGVVSLASHEARRELEHAVDEAASAAFLAEERFLGAPTSPGWTEEVETGVHLLTWIEGDASNPPPDWLRGEPFAGVVANGSMPYVLASRPGSLPDGNRYLVLVAVPFDDVSARMAEALDVELAMRPSILLRARAQDPWDGLPDRPAADDGTPEGVGDPVAAVSDALGEPLLDDRGHHAAEDLHAEEDDTSGAASLSLRLGLSEGGGGVPASTLLDVTVMDLASGQPLGTDAGGLPLVQLDFSAVDFIRDRAAGGRMEGILWQGIQILTITLGVMVLVAIAIGVGLTASVTRAVSALHRGTERIRGGALDHRINVRSRDQLGALADSFNQMTDSVAGLLREKADHERLEHEMAIAAEVQKHMLPEGFPTIPGLEGAARCVMAKQVGGDLYDFIPVGTNRLAILLGDVSGKGVSAALVMSNVVSAARSLLSGSDTPGPAALLTRLNRILHRTTSAETFVTLFYAEYDLRTGNLRYANAGHDWPFILSPEGEVLMELEASGLMLGALGDTVLEEREVVLAPGQVLVAYSDGLVDTINQDDEPFGVHRVRDAIRVHLEKPVGQMVDALVSRLQEFRGDAEEVDDVTMVVVRRVTRPGDVDPDRAGDPVPEEATA